MLTRMRILASRVAALFSSRRDDDEFQQELAAHLAMLTEENIRRGMPPEEAVRAARLRLGSDPQLRETHRDLRAFHLVETLWQDVRYALRILRRSPGFTAVAILTLALGIGANTAIFSLIDAVMFRTLPVPSPQQLVSFSWHGDKRTQGSQGYSAYGPCTAGYGANAGCSFSYPLFEQIHAEQKSFSGIFVFMPTGAIDISFHGNVSQASGQFASGDFFSAMQVPAAFGRPLGPTDDSLSAPPAIELSYAFWQRQFGADPSIVGKTLYLNRRPFTVAGIATQPFFGLDAASPVSFWLPFAFEPSFDQSSLHPSITDPGVLWLRIAGRLKPGLSLAQAQALTDPLFIRDVTSGPDAIYAPDARPHLLLARTPQGLSFLPSYSVSLLILLVAVGIVLLVACANIAGLTLARCSARQKEIAVRLALGAGRLRLIRQLLTETLVLAAAGGLMGIFLAYWTAEFIVSFFSVNTGTLLQINVHPDLRILGFACAVSALTGILAGLAPAFRGTHVDLTPSLKENASTLPGQVRRGRWLTLGNSLVVAQVALSILVLAAAGMFIRSLVQTETLNLGFDKKNLLTFRLDTTIANLPDAQTSLLYRNLQAQLASIHGVLAATYADGAPIDQSVSAFSSGVAGQPWSKMLITEHTAVGPEFFATMRIPILAGRAFLPADFAAPTQGSPVPVIANEAYVRKAFGNENPLGRMLSMPQGQIVGVVADASYHFVGPPDQGPTLYLPFATGPASFEIRTAANPKALIPAVRDLVHRANSELILTGITTVTDQIDRSLYIERLQTLLLSIFASLALLLACIGLFGLLAYEVSRRTREIGIRAALGARRGHLLRLVIVQGLALAGIGTVIGIAASVALTRFLSHQLRAVEPTDPFTFCAVAALLLLVALVACWIPARRAMRVDPASALRCE